MLGHSRARSFKPLTAAFTQGQRGVVTEPDLQAPNLHYLTCHRKTANPDANDGFQSGRYRVSLIPAYVFHCLPTSVSLIGILCHYQSRCPKCSRSGDGSSFGWVPAFFQQASHLFWALLYFLTIQDGSASCVSPDLALGSALCPRSPSSFYWRKTKIWVLSRFSATGVSLLLELLSRMS